MPGTTANEAAQSNDPVGEAQREIEQSQKELADAYKSLNQINPLTINQGALPPSGAPLGSELAGMNGSLGKILAQPALRKYVKLASSPEFSDNLAAVIGHPNHVQCLEAEAVWFIFILVLRTWRNSKSRHWIKNIWVYLWTAILFWVGAVYFIPHYFLDGAYDRLCSEIVTVIKE